MRALSILLLLTACQGSAEPPVSAEEASISSAAATAGWARYGAPFSLDESQLVQASELLAHPEQHLSGPILVEGRVVDVCQKAGCWMVIAEGEQTMRVLMKDHDFSVNKQGAGSTCRIEGIVEVKVLDPKEVAHLESESAALELMPERRAVDNKMYQFIASGVAMKES